MRGEKKFNVSSGTSKEIAGLKKNMMKMMKMMKMMTPGSARFTCVGIIA